jgi:hypothetical protein
MNICNGENVPKNVINALNSDEKDLFNQILHISGMNKHIQNTGNENVSGLKNRSELIINRR